MIQYTNKKSRGSVIVDAAVSLPIFILSFALIFSLIKEAGEEAALVRKLSEKTNLYSAGATVITSACPYLILVGKTESFKFSENVYYRPFCGESEEAANSDISVYIYPKAGEKYHKSSCSTLENNPDYVSIKKSEAIQQGYTECELCGYGGKDYFKK